MDQICEWVRNLLVAPSNQWLPPPVSHIAHSPLCQKGAANGPFQNARQLEHGAKVTEAVGGAQGGMRRRGRGKGPRDEQLQL